MNKSTNAGRAFLIVFGILLYTFFLALDVSGTAPAIRGIVASSPTDAIILHSFGLAILLAAMLLMILNNPRWAHYLLTGFVAYTILLYAGALVFALAALFYRSEFLMSCVEPDSGSHKDETTISSSDTAIQAAER